MQVKLVMFKNGRRRDIDVPEGITVIGRKEDCGLRVPVNDVSREHCRVTVGADGVLVKDLGSVNGTYVNDKRITEAPLKPGDVIKVGPVMFTVQIDGKPANIISPEELAAALGSDDSGEIPEMELEALDELDFDLDEDSGDIPPPPGAKSPAASAARGGSATNAAPSGGEENPLDALEMLGLDDLDEPDKK